jgi:hypothetical protein
MLHCLAMAGLAAATVIMRHEINAITDTFIESREADAHLFAKLVRDNWDGISTISSEKKEILVRNLDPALAGADLRAMRDLMLLVVYAFMAAFAIQTLVSAIKTWRAANASDAL